MKLDLIRYRHTEKQTFGLLFIDSAFVCYTMEDVMREGEEKVPGQTAIPMGLEYPVYFREQNTPLTLKYRKRFDWFTHHIEILDITGFQYVYFHLGNDETDTDGCILLGDTVEDDRIKKSEQAFERFYKLVGAALKRGEIVELNVKKFFSWDIVL